MPGVPESDVDGAGAIDGEGVQEMPARGRAHIGAIAEHHLAHERA
jgi:hypothetical protein